MLGRSGRPARGIAHVIALWCRIRDVSVEPSQVPRRCRGCRAIGGDRLPTDDRGWSPATPAAVIVDASKPQQQVWRGR